MNCDLPTGGTKPRKRKALETGNPRLESWGCWSTLEQEDRRFQKRVRRGRKKGNRVPATFTHPMRI